MEATLQAWISTFPQVGDDPAAVHRTDLDSTAGEDGRIFAGQVQRFVDIRRVQDV